MDLLGVGGLRKPLTLRLKSYDGRSCVSSKSWPQNVGVSNVHYGLKFCVNRENNKQPFRRNITRKVHHRCFDFRNWLRLASFTFCCLWN